MPKIKSWLPFSGVLFFSTVLFALVITLFAGGVSVSHAAVSTTWYVNAGTGNDSFDCMTPGTACATIGAAVAKASATETIEVAAGTYLEYDITIYKELTINGAGADAIIDGYNAGRVIYAGSVITISNVTIQNGQIITPSSNVFDISGGGIMALLELTLQDTIIISNSVVGGGGAIFNNGKLVINNSEIRGNTADANGGGIYNFNSGVITVTDSLIASNAAYGVNGGGISTIQPLYLRDVTIRDNTSSSTGGGLSTSDETVLDSVSIYGNQAANGAAHHATSGTISYTNVTVSDNTASQNSGGLWLVGSSTSLYLQNSTIANNKRANAVGTGYNGLNISSATVNIVNSIIANNDDRNCGGTSGNWTSLGYNISSDYHCAFTETGDQQGVDPLLGDLADNDGPTLTHALLPGSEAIDAGTNSACPPVDQREFLRPYDGDNDGTATCDIGAFESGHQITIGDVSVIEGDVGTTNAVFTVTLAPTSSLTVEVDYQTLDGTATAGSDYTNTSEKLTFNPGETTQFITVLVDGDSDDENDETFLVNLSNAVNAQIIDGQATGTIVDDDGLPSLSIADQTVLEGNIGTVNAVFAVTLSPVSDDTVTVNYDTVAGSATAGDDYTAVSDTLTFDPGQSSKEITIPVKGDLVDEGVNEMFTVELSTPINANLVDDVADGTITDDDTARVSMRFGPTVPEGNSGFSPATFTVTLSTPADFEVTVDYELSGGFGDDGAKPGEDYVDSTDTVVFPAGTTTQFIYIDIIGDTLAEMDEVFLCRLLNGSVPITTNSTNGWILNDDFYNLFLPIILG